MHAFEIIESQMRVMFSISSSNYKWKLILYNFLFAVIFDQYFFSLPRLQIICFIYSIILRFEPVISRFYFLHLFPFFHRVAIGVVFFLAALPVLCWNDSILGPVVLLRVWCLPGISDDRQNSDTSQTTNFHHPAAQGCFRPINNTWKSIIITVQARVKIFRKINVHFIP